jgi:hypothetical protein
MNGLILFIGSLTNFKLVNLLNKFMFKDKYNVIAQKVKFQAKQNPTSSSPPPFFSLLMFSYKIVCHCLCCIYKLGFLETRKGFL